jgi:hypothetical protein
MLLTFSLVPKTGLDITLRPTLGLIVPGAHQIFLVSTCPKGTSWKQHIFYLQFNFYPQYRQVGNKGRRAESLGVGHNLGLLFSKSYSGVGL